MNDMIENVKKGLKIRSTQFNCLDKNCPYKDPSVHDCCDRLAGDALSVIEELQEENKALRLLLDWAVECDFGYDQFFVEYQKYKHETEGLGYTEGMIKVARCVLAEKES